MRSPQEVAAAQAEFLDELEARVGRFAWGADRSRRYARELHDWLAELYAQDRRFDPVLTALRDYRVKVAQEEVADACRVLLRLVRDEVEGPRFPWQDVPHEKQALWRAAFAASARGVNVAAACPVCRQPMVRRYFRKYESGSAGGWEWCSSCFSYQHYRATVSASWEGDEALDQVPSSVLEHSPEFLERALRLHHVDSA